MWLRRSALAVTLIATSVGATLGASVATASAASVAATPAASMAATAPAALADAAASPRLAATVCGLWCDTRDPLLARQETFPVPERRQNNRRIVLHVSDVDGMAWGSIDDGTTGNAVWLDRSFDGGATWEGLLGRASIPGTWTGTRTLMYNISDPSLHRRGVIRACGDANGVSCTDWAHLKVCASACDGAATPTGAGDVEPVPATSIGGRRIALHVDTNGMAWGTLDAGRVGDEVWLDRSWDAGASWAGGSSFGRVSVVSGTGVRTVAYATREPRARLSGGAVRACGRAVEGASGSCTAWARPVAGSRADTAVDALMWWYDPYTAWWPSSWWNSAVAVTTVIDYLVAGGRRDHDWVVNRTFTVNRVPFAAGQRSTDAVEGNFISRAIDDAAWWGLAWARAYDLTGDPVYLAEARTIATYVHGYWDPSTCGGGVWWDRERIYKNAVTSGLYVRLAAALHNRTPGDTVWRDRARTGWTWYVASGLINPAGLVNDGLTGACRNNGQTVWTYNQGLAIGAAVEVWRATGDATVLATARRLADAAIAAPTLVRDGILTESCDADTALCDDNQKQFKGIFLRYLQDLDRVTGGAYRWFAVRQADAVWAADRDALNRLGQRWSGRSPAGYPNARDWRTQASAISALLAAA